MKRLLYIPVGITHALALAYGFAGLVAAAAIAIASREDAASWLQAIGGLLSVFAVSIIAIWQSSENRKNADIQTINAKEALNTNTKIGEAAIAAQSKLQKESLRHTEKLNELRSERERNVAVRLLQVTFETILGPLQARVNGPVSDKFTESWQSDYKRISSIFERVDLAALNSLNEISCAINAMTAIDDVWTHIEQSCSHEYADYRTYYLGLAKRRLSTAATFLSILDRNWTYDEEILTLTNREAETMNRLTGDVTNAAPAVATSSEPPAAPVAPPEPSTPASPPDGPGSH